MLNEVEHLTGKNVSMKIVKHAVRSFIAELQTLNLRTCQRIQRTDHKILEIQVEHSVLPFFFLIVSHHYFRAISLSSKVIITCHGKFVCAIQAFQCLMINTYLYIWDAYLSVTDNLMST